MCDVVDQSWAATGEDGMGTATITMSAAVLEAANELRRFLFQRVYYAQTARVETERAKEVIRTLYKRFMQEPGKLPKEYESVEDVERGVVDYIAGMTDNYALELAGERKPFRV